MESEQHSLQVPRTSSYQLLGGPSDKTERIWLACHGYGQLAKYFIKKLQAAAGPNDLIIAPEGLSRFYLRGNGGRVGASWMTKEGRISEINDQQVQLDLVLAHHLKDLPQRPQVIAFGFSQGTATIVRWAAKSKHQVDTVVCWAGTVPPDLEVTHATAKLNGKRAIIALGDADPYLSNSTMERDRLLLEQLGMHVSLIAFAGEHTIPEGALLQLKEIVQSAS